MTTGTPVVDPADIDTTTATSSDDDTTTATSNVTVAAPASRSRVGVWIGIVVALIMAVLSCVFVGGLALKSQTYDGAIEANKTAIAQNTTDIKDHEVKFTEALVGKGRKIEEVGENALGELAQGVKRVEGKVDNNKATLDTLSGDVTTNTTNIADLNGRVDGVEKDHKDLYERLYGKCAAKGKCECPGDVKKVGGCRRKGGELSRLSWQNAKNRRALAKLAEGNNTPKATDNVKNESPKPFKKATGARLVDPAPFAMVP